MVECPTRSGNKMNLKDVANELTGRILTLFRKDDEGKRRLFDKHSAFYNQKGNEHLVLFYEYFHGDTGRAVVRFCPRDAA